MERWESSQQRRRDFPNQNPSFSSTLLDSIYRSIDEPNGKNLREEEKEFVLYKERNTTKKKKQQHEEVKSSVEERWTQHLQPASLDTKIKPIRTSVERYSQEIPNKTKSSSSNSVSGSKAKKLYSDLKKMKQPISPGGKLATFLNSIFMAGKPKISPSNSNSSSTKFDQQRPTWFSRSCLNKSTPSSSRVGNNINNVKSSVTFYPVSIIVDEDSKPCGLNETTRSSELDVRVMKENRRVVEAAKELLKNYRKKKEGYNYNCNVINNGAGMDLDDDDDDGGASCASSDLFELDNLSAVGYREELPVYETTHVKTNRAIANGLMI